MCCSKCKQGYSVLSRVYLNRIYKSCYRHVKKIFSKFSELFLIPRYSNNMTSIRMFVIQTLNSIGYYYENENSTVLILKGIHAVASRENAKGLGLKSHLKDYTNMVTHPNTNRAQQYLN